MKLKSLFKPLLRGIGIRDRKNSADNDQGSAQGLIINDPLEHNSMSRVDEFYSDINRVAEYVSEGRLAFYSELIAAVVAEGIDFNGKSVADVGAGTGHFLMKLQEGARPKELVGFDFSIEAVARATEFSPNIAFYQHDLYSSFDRKFDVVFCMEVLEHLEYPDVALKNLIDMVDDGGVLVLAVPNGRIDTFAGHINFWSPESWNIYIHNQAKGLSVNCLTIMNNSSNLAIVRK